MNKRAWVGRLMCLGGGAWSCRGVGACTAPLQHLVHARAHTHTHTHMHTRTHARAQSFRPQAFQEQEGVMAEELARRTETEVRLRSQMEARRKEEEARKRWVPSRLVRFNLQPIASSVMGRRGDGK